EEREKILRKITLVALRQRTHDAEVERDVLAVVSGIDRDENIARMHVGVKEAVPKHLRKEDLDAGPGQALEVDARSRQLVRPTDRSAGHALHDEHVGVGPITMDFGNEEQR